MPIEKPSTRHRQTDIHDRQRCMFIQTRFEKSLQVREYISQNKGDILIYKHSFLSVDRLTRPTPLDFPNMQVYPSLSAPSSIIQSTCTLHDILKKKIFHHYPQHPFWQKREQQSGENNRTSFRLPSSKSLLSPNPLDRGSETVPKRPPFRRTELDSS